MPAYIVNLGSDESLRMYMRHGAYGTQIEKPLKLGRWSDAIEHTLADFLSMRSGDLIFFFRRRLIYGVGRLIGFQVGDEEVVAFENFPGSTLYETEPPDDHTRYLWTEDGEELLRWVIFFEPCPFFFKSGLDMDEVLQSDVKHVARTLPAFGGVSFAKMEDEEAQLILDLLLRQNEPYLNGLVEPDAWVYTDESDAQHSSVRGRAEELQEHLIKLDDQIDLYSDTAKGVVRHEALIQAWLARGLAKHDPEVTSVLGDWDYLANQVPASPQKPVGYMDRMDLFGLISRTFEPSTSATTVRYKIVEMKKDRVRSSEAIEQLMKYVAWVAHTRAGGDYGPVEAYFVARDFSKDVLDYVDTRVARDYIIPRRPYGPRRWDRLTLIQYRYTGTRPTLSLKVIREPHDEHA